jgi:hypothetical protein
MECQMKNLCGRNLRGNYFFNSNKKAGSQADPALGDAGAVASAGEIV